MIEGLISLIKSKEYSLAYQLAKSQDIDDDGFVRLLLLYNEFKVESWRNNTYDFKYLKYTIKILNCLIHIQVVKNGIYMHINLNDYGFIYNKSKYYRKKSPKLIEVIKRDILSKL
jgi:hypothetical protein